MESKREQRPKNEVLDFFLAGGNFHSQEGKELLVNIPQEEIKEAMAFNQRLKRMLEDVCVLSLNPYVREKLSCCDCVVELP